MYRKGVNSQFCHACLSSNRTLTMVGDFIDIYIKICDNVRMNVTSQVRICWECMTQLKKIWAFKKKVEKAQKKLDYCVKTQAPLPCLSYLVQAATETTTFPEPDEDKGELDKSDELMIKIADVRGQCEILDGMPVIDLTLNPTPHCDVTVEVEPLSPVHDEEQKYRRWKRTVLLVLKRLCGHEYAQHFLRPVSDDVAPLYSRIVRSPVDLGTIRRRIRDGGIRTTAQLERELLLMYSNALMYNSRHHAIYHMALELRAETLRELSLLSAAQSQAESPPSPPEPPLRCERARPPAPAPRRPSAAAEAPAPLKRRRASMQTQQASPDTPAATVRRRRASAWAGPPPVSTPPADSTAVRRRRPSMRAEPRVSQNMVAQTTGKESQRASPDTPAATVRRRRASAWAGPPPAATPPPVSTPPADTTGARRRRAPAWNWTSLDLDLEHLVPRHCVKKYKIMLL